MNINKENMNNNNSEVLLVNTINHKGFFLDLVIYISVMFLLREIYFPGVSFIINGLFWSFTSLAVATWRMRVRGVTWKDLGLSKPKKVIKTLMISGLILTAVVISLVSFNMIIEQFSLFNTPEVSAEKTISKFGDLKGNWKLFFSIIPLVLIESCLEELLDRGFLINWFEKLFSKTTMATFLAVVLQAVIFGFRHSYDLSQRSITVGIIGLIMGIAYVKFGRNLWPLIIAHCILNTMSFIDRV